ncbi:MAG TPA: magnesium transporter [Clostridia bacterium]|nr:magnesium transporter [Clostridia bacterium]
MLGKGCEALHFKTNGLRSFPKQLLDLLHSFTELQPADIADILQQMEEMDRAKLFIRLDGETAALVLRRLNTEAVESLLHILDPERIAAVLDEMSLDDAADFLGEVSENVKTELLDLMEVEEASDVKELLAYPEDTAGGIMTTEYVAILEDISAEKAIQVLRETAPDAETVYYVYVINTKNQLVGVISLRELIIANPETLITDIMQKKVISVRVDTDQEEVARVVTRYDFLAVPVIDHDRSLVGIVTVDDVIDVIHEEATEDIYRLAGAQQVEEDLPLPERLVASVRSRLPWLLVTLMGGMLAGQVLRGLETELSRMVALAFFIPLLTGMGGNVGTQSSTLTVRGLATGQIEGREVILTVLKESLVGMSIGAVCGLIVGTVAFLWQGNMALGLVVGLALLGNMTTAATMGTLVPLFFRRVGIDPAVASAPFISTSIDITGLLIYSILASALISYLV